MPSIGKTFADVVQTLEVFSAPFWLPYLNTILIAVTRIKTSLGKVSCNHFNVASFLKLRTVKESYLLAKQASDGTALSKPKSW